MKAGIVVDDYKIPVFEKELTKAGFTYEKFPFIDGTTTISVEYTADQLPALKALVSKVNARAIRNKSEEN